MSLKNKKIVLLSGDIGNRIFDEFKKRKLPLKNIYFADNYDEDYKKTTNLAYDVSSDLEEMFDQSGFAERRPTDHSQ